MTLLGAVAQGDLEGVRRLLEATQVGSLEERSEAGETPLLVAVGARRPDLAVLLLEHGANVHAKDAEGNDALMVAAECPCAPELIAILLAHGAKPDAVNASGRTALHGAAACCVEVVRLLLDAKADPNHATADEETPLTFAVTWGQEHVAELLLAGGASADRSDSRGWTPLTYAVQEASAELVALLLGAGADASAQDTSGVSALERATLSGNADVVRILLESARPPTDAQRWRAIALAEQRGLSGLLPVLGGVA